MARFTEEEKMLRRIDKRFSKGVVEYGLIEDGDKILIGLSGGKDSLALVELLARRARALCIISNCIINIIKHFLSSTLIEKKIKFSLICFRKRLRSRNNISIFSF